MGSGGQTARRTAARGSRPVTADRRLQRVAGRGVLLAPAPEPGGVNEYERKQLLERVEREGATVGADIPEEITVQGEPVELQSFVFEVKSRDTVPAGERERVQAAKKNLRRERLQRKQRLEDDDITRAEGETIVEAIVGIDRALNALERLDPADVEAEAERAEAADRKRWMSFLRQVLGHEESDTRRGFGR
jgi:hypothetical protein